MLSLLQGVRGGAEIVPAGADSRWWGQGGPAVRHQPSQRERGLPLQRAGHQHSRPDHCALARDSCHRDEEGTGQESALRLQSLHND